MCAGKDPKVEESSAHKAPGSLSPGHLTGACKSVCCLERVNPAKALSISESLLSKHGIGVFRVSGDSMDTDDVFDGDFVIVKSGSLPGEGDLVVASIRDEKAVIKRFHRSAQGIRLEAAHPSHPEMRLEEKDVKVQGIVVGILRKFGSRG